MSLSFVTVGYPEENFQGSPRLFAIGSQARYSPTTENQLKDLAFDQTMTSLWLYPSNSASAAVIVFSNDIDAKTTTGEFAGDYLQLITGENGTERRVNLLDFQLKDRVRSVLLVNTNRAPEIRVSFRDQFLDTWNSTLDSLMGSQASRKGDPLMTWTAFPEAQQYLDSSQIYLRITQALNINLDWWPDYNASITYYLFLFPDGSGRLQGFCQRWDTWVEGGIKSSEISNKLSAKATSGAGIINGIINTAFANLPPIHDLYYLPGRQLTPLDDVSDGSTWDDITLVLEL